MFLLTENIFAGQNMGPRDKDNNFIFALDRAPGYMGARDFHDLDRLPEDEVPTLATSNELAFVRAVSDEDAEAALQEALDLFVLTGAIKLYREQVGSQPGRFKHTRCSFTNP